MVFMFAFMFSGNAFSILKSNDYVLSTVSLCIVLTEFNANFSHIDLDFGKGFSKMHCLTLQ